MSGLVVFALALLATGGLAEVVSVVRPQPKKIDDPVFLSRQKNIILLYFHITEPLFDSQQQEIAKTYKIENYVEKYNNATAVKIAVNMIGNDWILPRAVPFTIFDPAHRFEAVTFYNVLYSAKDYDTFYKTAVYLRDNINEYLFTYILTTAIFHRTDTQGLFVPPLYEVFPSFFNNGEIMATIQRLSTHNQRFVEYYPSTYMKDDSIVIRWNTTSWPFFSKEMPMAYFTHDFGLNNYYYNDHLAYPFWLGGESSSLIKDKRGERFWFNHKQHLARYYMERLSNNLGEIPTLGLEYVEDGYTSGLSYSNGIPFPVRPNYFSLEQPWFVNEIEDIVEYERRIREAIDAGFFIAPSGEKVDIRNPEAIDVLGRLIEANVDSPNSEYYKDFISIWKMLLGNSIVHGQYYNDVTPLLTPSALELYQTTFRDPAFYMIWKRVMNLFSLWHAKLPAYKHEELALNDVVIKNVEIEKIVTYFEKTFTNVSFHTYLNEVTGKEFGNYKNVLVERPRLNHKPFSVRLTLNSEKAKNVMVRFFIAPKYDSMGREIPLHKNCENFFLFDTFIYALKQGENVFERKSSDNFHTSADLDSTYEIYQKVEAALNGKGEYYIDPEQQPDSVPKRVLLPKGRVEGMPFVMMVYVAEYHAPNALFGTGFDPAISAGFGSGARFITSYPLGYPVDRPLYEYQVKGLKNMWFSDIKIFHRVNTEMGLSSF